MTHLHVLPMIYSIGITIKISMGITALRFFGHAQWWWTPQLILGFFRLPAQKFAETKHQVIPLAKSSMAELVTNGDIISDAWQTITTHLLTSTTCQWTGNSDFFEELGLQSMAY